MDDTIKGMIRLESDMKGVKADMGSLSEAVKQNRDAQDKIFEIQGETLSKLNEIHNCLAGTEFDQSEEGHGGIVKRLGVVETCVNKIHIWKVQTTTRSAIIWIIISAALGGLWSLIIVFWGTLFT